jgi:hypothetical protein
MVSNVLWSSTHCLAIVVFIVHVLYALFDHVFSIILVLSLFIPRECCCICSATSTFNGRGVAFEFPSTAQHKLPNPCSSLLKYNFWMVLM